jgi:excinuclease UvrABC ATPase subunit
VVFTGVSGSRKSSLAFGTLYAEAQRRYLESVAPYARRLFHQLGIPEVDEIDGLPPAVAPQQHSRADLRCYCRAMTAYPYHRLTLVFADNPANIALQLTHKSDKILFLLNVQFESQNDVEILDRVFQRQAATVMQVRRTVLDSTQSESLHRTVSYFIL